MLRRQYQLGRSRTVVIGLGLDDHIALTRQTVCTRCHLGIGGVPAAVVFLDLADCTLTERDTESIDDVYIVSAGILYIYRTGVTADDVMEPVVRGCLMRHTVFFRYAGHTGIRDKSKDLRHAEIRRQVQVVRVIDDLITVRMEIDRISIYHHTGQQLLADQRRAHQLCCLRILMKTERNRIAPSCRSIGQDDIVLIRHDNRRELEDRRFAFRSHAVELVRRFVVFHVWHIAVTTVFQRKRVRMVLRIFLHHIALRMQFGLVNIRQLIVRPTRFGSGTGGLEKTRPGVVGYDGIRVLVIQTEVLVFRRREILVEGQRIDRSLHRITPRVEHELACLQISHRGILLGFYLIGRMTQLKRVEVESVGILRTRHTLPYIRPVTEMTGTRITRRGGTRMRQEVTLAVCRMNKGQCHVIRSCIGCLRIEVKHRVTGQRNSRRKRTQIDRGSHSKRVSATIRFGIPTEEGIIGFQTMRFCDYSPLTCKRILVRDLHAEESVVVIMDAGIFVRQHELHVAVGTLIIDGDTCVSGFTDHR